MHNGILLAVLLAGAVLFACLGCRLRQARKVSLRWFGAGLTGVLAIVLLLTGVAASVGHYRQYFSRRAPAPELRIEGTYEQLERGRAIADSWCGTCHSKTGTLTGDGDSG